MRIISFLFLAALLTALRATCSAADPERTQVRALLVTASPEAGPSDTRLAEFEPTLRRILRFESFRLAGEGSAQVSSPGQANLGMGRGHSLAITAEKSDARGVHLRIEWQESGRSLMVTGLVLRPGVPAVLGGPSARSLVDGHAVRRWLHKGAQVWE